MNVCECKFTYDGTSCDKYGLVMYDISDDVIEGGAYAGTSEIIEEHVPVKYKPLFYGTKISKKLEFQFIFGLNESRIDSGKPMTISESDDIATWLIGHKSYKHLEFDDDNMRGIRFKCMVTALEQITYGKIPWAMKATVTCDGPYAYKTPISLPFQINSSATIEVNNTSSHNGYYYPVIQFKPAHGGNLQIINMTDGGRVFEINEIPSSVLDMSIDNETLVITNSADLNLYGGFNKKAFRLIRGLNTLKVSGTGELIFHCEFPINVSG